MAYVRERPPLPPGPYLVAGLARSGQAAALLLHERGERVIGIDSGKPDGTERLRDAGVEVHLDGESGDYFDKAACVVKSPGVPREAPPVRTALSLGIPVIGELELAWRLIPNRFVAVTGTNGKTTVTELLGHVWRTARLPVAVAGNVGTPLASLVGSVDPDATVICEASSFQLEDTEAFAPECALLLNVSPDHLDRHGTFECYRADKMRVFRNQPGYALAIVDRSDPGIDSIDLPGRASEADISASALPFEPSGSWMLGAHNIANAKFAATAAIAMGVTPADTQEGIRSFGGVPHRLEVVAEAGGVTWVNDSKATNVAAAVAALRSFEGGLHVLMGGSLKGGGFAELVGPVAERCASVHLTGPAAAQILDAVAGADVPAEVHEDLPAAFAAASLRAKPGETVLLAPACASFDAYTSYEGRGDHFRALAQALAIAEAG